MDNRHENMFVVINDQQFKSKELMRGVGRAGSEERSIFNLTDWQKEIPRASCRLADKAMAVPVHW